MIKKLFLGSLLLGTVLSAEPKMEYQISLVGMNMDYREYDSSGDILDSEKSNYSDIAGAEINYRYFLNSNSNINVNILAIAGESNYVGSYIGSGLGYGSVESTTNNIVKDISIGYNAKNNINRNFAFLGGVGFGYRYWQRELSSTQIEEYTWFSARINVGLEFFYKNFTSSLIAEYQYGINPEMSATGFDDSFDLSSANIVKLSLPIRYKINRNFDITCAYVFEYQKIEESNVLYDSTATGYVEPDSTAYNQYIKVGMIFKY